MTLCCGPRTKEGGVCCLELTRELLIEKINDPQFPFGHDYGEIILTCYSI